MADVEAELIVRYIRDGDRRAFEQLVRLHQSAVRGLLRRLTCGDDALADDLAQETFLRAYRGLRSFRGGAKLSTWLYRIAYNVYLNERGRRSAPADEPHDAADERTAAPDGALLRHDLDRALGTLAPEDRALLVLAYGDEATHEDIAAVLGCPLGTVKTRILRAKQKLRRRLGAWAPLEAT